MLFIFWQYNCGWKDLREATGIPLVTGLLIVNYGKDHPDQYSNSAVHVEPDKGDLDWVLAFYRHGQKRGANYLYFDAHVELKRPSDELRLEMDPWTIKGVGTPSE